ncbi:MAG: FAD-linked oxidase [Cyclobacteriaceae bacterium]|nr:MAG: FAD-linked oxidase [Cyclobacteriaceae bacterium]
MLTKFNLANFHGFGNTMVSRISNLKFSKMETAATHTNNQLLGSEIFENFKQAFIGDLITSDHSDYDQQRQLWNGMIDKKPQLIAQCYGVSDVIRTVNFARDNNLLVAVRGGGHNVAGNAMNDDGIVIDLSQMRAVLVNPNQKTAIVQGGAIWRDVDRETQVFSLACAGGVVSDTGVGGLTLGGGLSWFRRKAGMSIDNLVRAQVVLADGSCVSASAEENQDLFWAIRGGGGNFGIVTSFEFNLYDLGPEVMFAACMYPRSAAQKVMDFWVEFTRDLPDEMTTDCLHWSIPEHEAFPKELHGKPVTALAGMYFGSPEEGRKALQPLREVAEPLLDLSNVYPYAAVNQMFDAFLVKGTLNSYWKSLYVDDLSDDLIKLILDKVNNSPSPQSLLSIRNLQGALSRVGASETAFGDRSGRFLVSIDTMWTDQDDDANNIQWTREFFSELHKHSGGQVYFNFNSDMSGSDNLAEDSYGSNYQKLVEIKTKYDPENFFRLNANIKPRS